MADRQRVEEAHRLLAQLGVTVAELQTAAPVGLDMPTVAEYLPRVIAAAGPGARRTYGNYWARMAALWGDRRLDAILATDIEALQREAAATAVPRRNGRGGRHAGEHVIAAARAFFIRAITDGLIAAADSPAHQIAKPRRLPTARRALTPRELAEINDVARTSGNDAILDALLLRLHTETACRRGGALALRRTDLDPDQGLVRLREKGETLRWQPISLDLAAHLVDHADNRGVATPWRGPPPASRRCPGWSWCRSRRRRRRHRRTGPLGPESGRSDIAGGRGGTRGWRRRTPRPRRRLLR
jgi:hypothetical protein